VVLLGPPGTGKTHVAIALGIAGCHTGQRVSAYDLTCRLKYDLTCRSRHCDHGMGSPPATRVSRSLRR
jgi:hypothetical protein